MLYLKTHIDSETIRCKRMELQKKLSAMAAKTQGATILTTGSMTGTVNAISYAIYSIYIYIYITVH